VGVLCGDQTTAGQALFQGWLNLRKERLDVVQVSVQNAAWEEREARSAAALMLRAHPEVTVVWAANDSMALGALDAVRAVGKEPGVDVLVGGMDLLARALERVADGQMTVTLGGHVLDGARSLLLVHDHLQGQDFEPFVQRSLLEPVTAALAPSYLRFLEQQAWRRVDFERFSRARRLGARAPALTFASLLDPA
jgi:ABC-type sugar transport system substrate-binding protein